jgi:hypothetical protein
MIIGINHNVIYHIDYSNTLCHYTHHCEVVNADRAHFIDIGKKCYHLRNGRSILIYENCQYILEEGSKLYVIKDSKAYINGEELKLPRSDIVKINHYAGKTYILASDGWVYESLIKIPNVKFTDIVHGFGLSEDCAVYDLKRRTYIMGNALSMSGYAHLNILRYDNKVYDHTGVCKSDEKFISISSQCNMILYIDEDYNLWVEDLERILFNTTKLIKVPGLKATKLPNYAGIFPIINMKSARNI